MADNRQVINSINVSSTEVKCPGCGGTIGIRFDPSTGKLVCPFCGLASQLPAPGTGPAVEELDFNSAIQRANVDWGRSKKLIVCTNCGGETLYDSEQVTGACPFCGSSSVAPAAENTQVLAPNAVIPFAVSKDITQQCLSAYLNRKHCITKKVRDSRLENVVGIYLPFMTFDTYTVSSYYAYNDNYQNVSEKYVTGVWNQYIDDVIIFASDRIRHPYISKIQKFNFDGLVPYSPEYLAGIPAERYTTGLNEGWERVKKLIPEKLKKDIRRANKNLYVEKLATNYYNVKFRYVLAPVYLASYRQGKNRYPVAINGQTGETFCEAPTYLPKMIILCVLAGILILISFLLFMFVFPEQARIFLWGL